jgi:hypothetical protein
MPKRPVKRTIKITDTVRVAALKLPLTPSITKDSEIRGFALIVTTRDVFWVQFLQPRGRDPDGKRWRVVRHKLGDAQVMVADEARTAALAAKVASRSGRETRIRNDWPPRLPLWLSARSCPRPPETP